ncbi:MAG: hypothetical protein V4495_05215 [Pseudomonadota bacterium]
MPGCHRWCRRHDTASDEEEELKDGRLVQLISYWILKHGIVHPVFPSRRWIRPVVRSLIDMLDERFKDLPNNWN